MYVKKLKADFAAMDTDNSGFITPENLKEMASRVDYILSTEELEQTMKDLDLDGDGKISIEEFMAATVSNSICFVHFVTAETVCYNSF